MIVAPSQLMPDWAVEDYEGRPHRLWDYRQKSHLVLLFDPAATPETRQRWQAAIQIDRKQWEWLQTAFLLVQKGPDAMVPGVYLIDRYGCLLSYFTLDHWDFDQLEREFLYYEARHC